ncbi:hypothetical protein D2962_09560 [Biomaibacter acetigenes]|uniref:DUF2508 family protein n=1 Tax=Biomaibacter acetigenes TaxID=2316383 RepID=A0A3G2R600_9FIRM|nr:hypothetical protein [Biomaibacter acetigenes]AYO30826.1 hypothetical protein D2962_09560 [Biomaibacter acetigenes]
MSIEKDIFAMHIQKAQIELALAEQDLEYAEPDFIDAAIYELMAKRKKLDTLIKKAKGCA